MIIGKFTLMVRGVRTTSSAPPENVAPAVVRITWTHRVCVVKIRWEGVWRGGWVSE